VSEPRVRALAAADVPRLDGVLRSAYQTPRSFLGLLREAVVDPLACTFVVEYDGMAVGMGTLNDYRNAGFLAQIGVDPLYQRRGFGRLVTQALMAEAQFRGHQWIELDATPEGEALYRSLGFVEVEETIAYEGPVFGARAHAAIERVGLEACDELAGFDHAVLGLDRSAPIRRWLADRSVHVFLKRRNGAIVGYAAARIDRVAPWIALDDRDAEQLFDTARAALSPVIMLAFAPRNEHARATLETRGFHAGQRTLHMVYGTRARAVRDAIRGRTSFGEG
jgi:GNAT superfamily N-acetyltransferase